MLRKGKLFVSNKMPWAYKKLSLSHLSYINPKVKLRRRRTEKGLFAVKDIRKGEIVTISAGIGLPQSAVRRLPRSVQKFCYYVESGFFYCPLVIPPSADWYMNHSCNPNVSSPKEAFTLRAIRSIKTGEEILYDYREDYMFYKYRPIRKFKCHCGSQGCKKIVRH